MYTMVRPNSSQEQGVNSSRLFKPWAILAAMTELGALQIVLALSGLIRNKVAAVYLRASGMGEWSQILGVATTAFVIVQFGMMVGLSRNTAAAHSDKDRQRQLSVANTLTMGLAFATTLAAIALFFTPSRAKLLTGLGIPTTQALLLLVFVVLLAPIEGLRNNYLSFLQGMLDIRGISSKRAIAVIVATVAAIPLVIIFGIPGACMQFALASVLLAALLGHRCYQLGYRPIRFQWDGPSAVSLATLGGASLLVSFAYSLVDVLIRSQLIHYAGFSGAGVYQAAFLLSSQVTQIVLGSIGVFSLSSISRSAEPDVISQQLRLMYRVILPVSAVGLGLLGLLERPLVQLLFSPQFGGSSTFLPLLLIGNAVQAASWIAGAPLLACGRVRTWLALEMIGASIRYIAVVTLLPVFGTQAIPLAFVLGQMFGLIACTIVCSRRMKIMTSRVDLARLGLSSGLPGVLALIGLHVTVARLSAGVIVLVGGAMILAPAHSSRRVLRAARAGMRWRPRNKTRADRSPLAPNPQFCCAISPQRVPTAKNVVTEASISSDGSNAEIQIEGNMSPLVSVIIPSYNSGCYLADAVRSVFGQTYSPLECIVIDDGSTDHTEDVLSELQAQYPGLKRARKANGGLSSARNAGLELCSGSLISFLDADDVLLPDKIERQVAFLNSHPEVDLVYGDYLIVTETLRPSAIFSAQVPRGLDPLDAFCYRNWFAPMVPLVRRTVTDKVGQFDLHLAAAEDWDYWIRCVKVARISYLAGPVAVYRLHGGQMSRDYSCMKRGTTQVAVKNFCNDRKRLRMAMAAIELTHARYLWKQRKLCSSLIVLMKFAFRNRLGLHMGNILPQIKGIAPLQLKPLTSGEIERSF